MPKFAANITTMFQEYDPLDRFDSAAEAGFKAVEILSPYNWSYEQLRNCLSHSELELILINTKPGVDDEATVGLAAIPGRQDDFKKLFLEALGYAATLGASMIHTLAGVVAHVEERKAEDTFLRNISWAAEQAAEHEINIMLEPLNQQDVPGYFYTSSQQVVDVIHTLNLKNVKLQYDFYHMQIVEGNLAANVAKHLNDIGHIQFSSVPGRFEPQYGEVNLTYLFNHLDEIGYNGWIGCEYKAKHSTAEGLSWAKQYGLSDS